MEVFPLSGVYGARSIRTKIFLLLWRFFYCVLNLGREVPLLIEMPVNTSCLSVTFVIVILLIGKSHRSTMAPIHNQETWSLFLLP